MIDENTLHMEASKRIRELLEDFEAVGTISTIAIIPRYPYEHSLRDNVYAAVKASTLRLSSLDYAKKQYCKTDFANKNVEDGVEAKYVLAYKAAKDYVLRLIRALSAEDKPLPSRGVFGASLVLERLTYSFFSAHLLYKLGHRYEAHAVSRLILEQIAWAYAAYPLDDIDAIKKIVTTKAVSKLRKAIPGCGIIYGFLSNRTHLDYDSHHEFLRVENSNKLILHTQFEYYEYAQVILHLADLFGIVWELSQVNYLNQVQSIVVKDGGHSIREDRPFLKIMEERLNEVEKSANKALNRIGGKRRPPPG